MAQAARFHAETGVPVEATSLQRDDPYRLVGFGEGRVVNSRAVLIATRVSYRKLDVPGGTELTGRGIFYGSSPVEAAEAKGEEVAVIGGGNSAGQAALYLSALASKVTLIARGASLGEFMSAYLTERIVATENIKVLTTCEVLAAEGDPDLELLTLRQGDADPFQIADKSAFVFIGQKPRVGWLTGQLETDEMGFIRTGFDCTSTTGWTIDRARLPLETSVPGVFAAGAVRSGSIKRIASAAGEGAMAVSLIHKHLEDL